MTNFLISIVVLSASIALLWLSIKYGLKGAGRMDEYLLTKTGGSFNGFKWWFRLPFGLGLTIEYFFFWVLGHENYFKTNWWMIRAAALLSILIALATLYRRTPVYEYLNLTMVREGGISALFSSGFFVWYINFVMLLYFTLFVLIVIESIKMQGIYSPVRIFTYSLLSFLMADLMLIVLGLIVVLFLIYLVLKVIWFMLFSSRRRRRRHEEEDEESTGDILRGGLALFKEDLEAWESELKTQKSEIRRERSEKEEKKAKPKIRIRRKRTTPKMKYGNEVPRLHPD
jgi:hypothetical protein